MPLWTEAGRLAVGVRECEHYTTSQLSAFMADSGRRTPQQVPEPNSPDRQYWRPSSDVPVRPHNGVSKGDMSPVLPYLWQKC